MSTLVIGSILGLAWAFTISLAMTEGGYRVVPQSQWWLVRAEMVGALLLPLAVGIAVTIMLAARPIRRFVVAWGLGLGAFAAILLLLYTSGVV